MSTPEQPPEPPGPHESSPATVGGAVVDGVALLLRDALLNGAVLLSLVVGIGGVLTGRSPWLWLGPVIGVLGVAAAVPAMRERRNLQGRRVWAVVLVVLLVDVGVMALMWA